MDYITTTERTVTTEQASTEDYKTVFEVEDFIASNTQSASPISTSNIEASCIETGTTQIILQGNVASASNIQQIILDPKTTVVTELDPEDIKKEISIYTKQENEMHEFELVGYTQAGKKQYRCCLCNALTMDPAAHRPVHSNECPYVCTEPGCNKAYKRKSALKHHITQVHMNVPPQSCMKCGKTFSTKYLLQKHLTMTCTDAKPFICKVCGKSFKVLARLKYHEGMHVVNKPFNCPQCGKGMASKAHLKVHMVVHEQGNYECYCGKSFPSAKRYKEHYRQIHSNHNLHRCERCERNFKNEQCLEKHMMRHKNKLYLCQVCRRGFKNSITCAWHEQKVHKIPHADLHDVDNDTTCPVCLKEMKNKGSLMTHIIIHADVESKYSCPKCSKVFSRKKLLDSHLQDVHVERSFPCPSCNKLFKHEKHLREHINSHSKPFGCSVCGGRFANERYLKKHEADHKKGLIKEKTYICPHCNETFPTCTNFKIHIKDSHPDMPEYMNIPIREKSSLLDTKGKYESSRPKNYNCEVCDLTFISERKLISHEIKKHTDSNRLSCDKCEVKFVTPRTLKKHQFECHSVGEELVCETCGRKFYSDVDLDNHDAIVHGKKGNPGNQNLKLNACILCLKYFRDVESLVVHECKHYKRDLVCKICRKKFSSFPALKEHMSRCSEYICMYCLAEFKTPFEKYRHVEEHLSGGYVCKCEYCSEVFLTEDSHKHHMSVSHAVPATDLSEIQALNENSENNTKPLSKILFQSFAPVTTSSIKVNENIETKENTNFKSLLLSFGK